MKFQIIEGDGDAAGMAGFAVRTVDVGQGVIDLSAMRDQLEADRAAKRGGAT